MTIRWFVVMGAMLASVPSLGWGGVGHKAVTYMAIDLMRRSFNQSEQMPGWLFTGEMRDRAAYQSIEVDRFRAVRDDVMSHENNPEHYLDLEMLELYGLTLETMPRLRREFIERIVMAHENHQDRFEGVFKYDRERDDAMVYYFPGFAPYAAMEEYYKLVASFRMVRILDQESGENTMRLDELAQAQANVLNHMGNLSHWIGDLAQPLHTTIHHHGWKGENPEGYTTEYAFHEYIDSGILEHHGLGEWFYMDHPVMDEVGAMEGDPWDGVRDHMARSFAQLEPLYAMDSDGTLKDPEGKEFIVERLADGGRTLGRLYIAAWEASAIDDEDIENYRKYEPAPYSDK